MRWNYISLNSYRYGYAYSGTLITDTFTYKGNFLVPSANIKSPVDSERDPIFHGTKGILINKSGKIYEGQFSHGRYHGKGCERIPSGMVYSGDYKSGQWHGQGELVYEHVNTEGGLPKRNKQRRLIMESIQEEKESILSCDSTNFNPNLFRYSYSGTWEYGEREGSGFEKIIFAEGGSCNISLESESTVKASTFDFNSCSDIQRTATFSGEFHRDRRQGFGVLSLPGISETVIVGNWKNGMPVTSTSDDNIDDRLIGTTNSIDTFKHPPPVNSHQHESKNKSDSKSKWKINYPDGNCYQGECMVRFPKKYESFNSIKKHLHINTSTFLCLVPHGYGQMIFSAKASRNKGKGAAYTGFWKKGSRHGHGHIAYDSLEESYKGTWLNDFPGELNFSNSVKKSRYQKPKHKIENLPSIVTSVTQLSDYSEMRSQCDEKPLMSSPASFLTTNKNLSKGFDCNLNHLDLSYLPNKSPITSDGSYSSVATHSVPKSMTPSLILLDDENDENDDFIDSILQSIYILKEATNPPTKQ